MTEHTYAELRTLLAGDVVEEMVQPWRALMDIGGVEDGDAQLEEVRTRRPRRNERRPPSIRGERSVNVTTAMTA